MKTGILFFALCFFSCDPGDQGPEPIGSNNEKECEAVWVDFDVDPSFYCGEGTYFDNVAKKCLPIEKQKPLIVLNN